MKQIEEYFPQALLQRYGSSVEEAGRSAVHAVERFIEDLARVPEERLHSPVTDGGWSPAQYADHLYRVTLLYTESVEKTVDGTEAPVEHERGWVTDSGGLVSAPEGEPAVGRNRAELEDDLRSSTAALVDAVHRAAAAGAVDRVSHVNPYFGPLTPLGCLQMAAVHARHHSRKHLAAGE
jgi:uncharacterized damage-inducible protein DinB